MFIRFKKWFVSNQNRRILIAKWWAWWSNKYQIFEKKFLKTDLTKLKKYNKIKMKYGQDIMFSWKSYCEDLELKHWGEDKWYQLFDVISCPERIVCRKKVDCDDYARLAFDFFGQYIQIKGEIYSFDGIYSIVFENMKAHAIALWKNNLKNKYIIVSNDNIYLNLNLEEYASGFFSDTKLLYYASFKINEKTGIISFKKLFNYEEKKLLL